MTATGRANKPQCESCSHPISFHGTEFEACRALGCSCGGYTGLTYEAVATVNTAEAARILGKSENWVVRHAEEVGGTKTSLATLRVERDARGKRRTQRGHEWRFVREAVEGHLARGGCSL